MVITGIVSFINKQCNIRKAHELHDTFLVIDGHSLQSLLYRQSSELSHDYIFGSDYTAFAENIRRFFRRLAICNIYPIVVYNGVIDSDKYLTCFNARIAEIKQIKSNDYECISCQSATLSNYVFLSVAKEFQAIIIQSLCQTFSQTVVLANTLKCPIMSDKSDFLLLNVDYGVIQFEMLRWIYKPLKFNSADNYWYLTCKHYHIDNLVNKYLGLKKQVLPLFAAIMENDSIDSGKFQQILNCQEENNSLWVKNWKPLYDYNRHENMDILLDFLRGKDTEKAIHILLTNGIIDEQCEQQIQLSMKKYQIDNNFNYLMPENITDSKIFAKGDNQLVLPNWFLCEYQIAIQRPAIMNIIVNKTHVLYPQIENFSLPSSYQFTLPLRKFLYGLLRTENDNAIPIKVLDRSGLDLLETQETPLQHLSGGQYVPMLHEVRHWHIKERKALLLEMLGIRRSSLAKLRHMLITYQVSAIEDFVETIGFLAIALKYFRHNSEQRDRTLFVRSLITSMIFFSYPYLVKNEKLVSLCVTRKHANHENTKYNPSIVHLYAQFQACLHVINFINSILEYPLIEGKPYFCLNGIFLYNLSYDLSFGPLDSDLADRYINRLLDNWSLSRLYYKLCQFVFISSKL